MPYKLVNLDEELDYNHVFYRDELYSVRKYWLFIINYLIHCLFLTDIENFKCNYNHYNY
jgi:hypothetical protein